MLWLLRLIGNHIFLFRLYNILTLSILSCLLLTLTLNVHHHVLVDIECNFALRGNVGGNVLNRTLLLYMMQYPVVYVLIELIASEETYHLL